jgi:hypothetical protein
MNSRFHGQPLSLKSMMRFRRKRVNMLSLKTFNTLIFQLSRGKMPALGVPTMQPFQCPYDNLPLPLILWNGFDVQCSNCGFWFRATTGRVTRRRSDTVTLRRKSGPKEGMYQRHYAVELELPTGRRTFEWTLPGRDETVLIRQGDEAAIVESATSRGVLIVGAGRMWPWSVQTIANFGDGSEEGAEAAGVGLVVGLIVLWLLDGFDTKGVVIVLGVALLVFFQAKSSLRIKPLQFQTPATVDAQEVSPDLSLRSESEPPELPGR